MEELNKLIELLGVDPGTFAALSAVVFTLVNFLKGKAPEFFNGVRTEIAAVVISLLLSFKVLAPAMVDDWIQVGVLTVLLWLVPAGFHKTLKPK